MATGLVSFRFDLAGLDLVGLDLARLDLDGVSVWHGPLDGGAARLAACRATLPEDERRVADRLAPPALPGYVIGRAMLRRILARLTGAAPADLRFGAGPRGKPALEPGCGDVEFNLSHSRTHWAIAVSRLGPVGVDVEETVPAARAELLAGWVMGDRERTAFLRLPPEARAGAFTRLWVRKEAVLKASGLGLGGGLAGLEVGWSGDGCEAGRPHSWRVTDLDLAAGTYSALAVPARPGFFLA